MPASPVPLPTWGTISRAAASGATTGLAWSWARAVVANNSVQSATACSTVSNSSTRSRIWSAPAAARCALTFGHRARGHADVLAELGLDEDDNGAGELKA